jgi:flagellin
MSSILTNPGATAALTTLKSIGAGLAEVQTQLGTGLKVSNARDNAAVWSISKTMQADVAGFKRVSDSLVLGQSTLAVARQGAETIADLLTEMKGKVVSAQQDNVDRAKIQADIGALREQIDTVVQTAGFNGQALLQNRDTETGSGTMAVLGAINRGANSVTPVDIEIRKRDLATADHVIAAAGGTYDADAVTATLDATQSRTLDASGITVETGMAFSLSVFGTDADGSAFDQDALRTTAAATEDRAEMVAGDLSYVARDGDTMGDVLYALGKKFDAYALSQGIGSDTLSLSHSGSTLRATSGVTDGTDTIAVALNTLSADAGNTVGGGLGDLSRLDVRTAEGANEALGRVESLIGIAVDAAAALGTDQSRMDRQQAFTETLADSLRSGIGQLVDADLEETSARLQALQVQQQLAVQALGIANAAPQALLGLFR